MNTPASKAPAKPPAKAKDEETTINTEGVTKELLVLSRALGFNPPKSRSIKLRKARN